MPFKKVAAVPPKGTWVQAVKSSVISSRLNIAPPALIWQLLHTSLPGKPISYHALSSSLSLHSNILSHIFSCIYISSLLLSPSLTHSHSVSSLPYTGPFLPSSVARITANEFKDNASWLGAKYKKKKSHCSFLFINRLWLHGWWVFVCVSSKKYVFRVEQARKFIDLHLSPAASVYSRCQS